ncbi:YdhK family protein [Janibacter sp. GXQ6167]|uniref:YdhK family protein n=1 Tax=Janibacter sp. GXQ6167 TaxID=3240791 RepID=UPI0035235045
MSRRMNRAANRRLGAVVGAGLLSVAVVLAGCAGDNADEDSPAGSSQEHGEHGGMDHPADGGPVPEGMTEATDPAYPVGTEVTLAADHMEGMDGATATIVGAYDTYTYSVDYTPTTGGDPITDHRWVVQEELADAGDERLADGTEVTLDAAHMDGMDGATATVASSTEETVYVVDFEAGGMTMTNHKWVVESEIQPAS